MSTIREHAKFISIWKFKLRALGKYAPKTIYTIGILTDENHYYFHEMGTLTSSAYLTYRIVKNLKNVFLSNYDIDDDTAIVLEDTISNKELMYLFFFVMFAAKRRHIMTVRLSMVFKTINSYHKYIKPCYAELPESSYNTLVEKLVDKHKIPWLTNENYLEYTNMSVYEYKKHVYPALGVYYLLLRSIRNAEYEKCMANKAKQNDDSVDLEEYRKQFGLLET